MSAAPQAQLDVRDRQLAVLAGLVQLERRVRAAATLEELGFLVVNDTHMLAGYRQAVLWRCDTARVQAVSGLAAPDRDAPFTLWLTTLFRDGMAGAESRKTAVLTAADLPAAEQAMWAEHLPRQALWLPLRRPDGSVPAVLLLARDDPWHDGEKQLLDTLADAYAHAWVALAGKPRRGIALTRSRKVWAGVAVAALLLLALPVRQSVLAPAELVARDPAILRAPVQGVVAEMLVKPNEAVEAGRPLARLDPRELESRLEVARQSLGVAEAELRQAQQTAMFDEKAKAALAVLQGRREQQAAEVAYVEELLRRITLVAPRAGVAIFDDAGEWVGRPVALGERILMLAEPRDAELEIHLPVSDAIALPPGADVRLFLNTDPASPLDARLVRAGYRAGQTPEGVMAYRLRATLTGDDPRVRIGLKGTAKLYGERTSLFMYLMRRPLAALRLRLGL